MTGTEGETLLNIKVGFPWGNLTIKGGNVTT